DVLQGGRAYLVLGCGRLEVEQRSDIPAHECLQSRAGVRSRAPKVLVLRGLTNTFSALAGCPERGGGRDDGRSGGAERLVEAPVLVHYFFEPSIDRVAVAARIHVLHDGAGERRAVGGAQVRRDRV